MSVLKSRGVNRILKLLYQFNGFAIFVITLKNILIIYFSFIPMLHFLGTKYHTYYEQ